MTTPGGARLPCRGLLWCMPLLGAASASHGGVGVKGENRMRWVSRGCAGGVGVESRGSMGGKRVNGVVEEEMGWSVRLGWAWLLPLRSM